MVQINIIIYCHHVLLLCQLFGKHQDPGKNDTRGGTEDAQEYHVGPYGYCCHGYQQTATVHQWSWLWWIEPTGLTTNKA